MVVKKHLLSFSVGEFYGEREERSQEFVVLQAFSNRPEAIARVKEPCLDFIDSLWSAAGGFHGNWADDTLDPEYTYYGLLALGHLAL